MENFKVGDTVVVLRDSSSVNLAGDVGIVTEVEQLFYSCRVTVAGRENRSNWHSFSQLSFVNTKN